MQTLPRDVHVGMKVFDRMNNEIGKVEDFKFSENEEDPAVIPEDVEAALQRIDAIAEAVVFGLPNARVGALVAAVIETRPGRRPPSARELRRQAGELLSGTHLPRRWYWTERLPRTAAGKPARERIRRDAIEGMVASLV